MKIKYYSIDAKAVIGGLTYNATRELSSYNEDELPLIFAALTNRNIFYNTYVSFYDENENCAILFYQEANGYHFIKSYTKSYPTSGERHFNELNYKQFVAMIKKYL